jgi:hypothetical protein
MKKHDDIFEAITNMDHPMSRKLKELSKETFGLSANDTEKFLSEWKKNNPEDAKAMYEWITTVEIEYKESRREVKAKLGYSRIGLGNV